MGSVCKISEGGKGHGKLVVERGGRVVRGKLDKGGGLSRSKKEGGTRDDNRNISRLLVSLREIVVYCFTF